MVGHFVLFLVFAENFEMPTRVNREISFLFHLVSWIVTAVQIFIILLRHDIDTDGVTGLCFTGLKSTNTQLWFVLRELN